MIDFCAILNRKKCMSTKSIYVTLFLNLGHIKHVLEEMREKKLLTDWNAHSLEFVHGSLVEISGQKRFGLNTQHLVQVLSKDLVHLLHQIFWAGVCKMELSYII